MPASNSSSWLYSVGHTKATGQGFLLVGAPVVDVCSWLEVVVEQTGHVGQFADVTVGQFTGVEVVSNVFADVVVGLIVGVKSRVQTSL